MRGKSTLLTFQKNIGAALKKACDHDSDAMHLARAAEVVRREMFEKNSFNVPAVDIQQCQTCKERFNRLSIPQPVQHPWHSHGGLGRGVAELNQDLQNQQLLCHQPTQVYHQLL